jgi:hypothetical protein
MRDDHAIFWRNEKILGSLVFLGDTALPLPGIFVRLSAMIKLGVSGFFSAEVDFSPLIRFPRLVFISSPTLPPTGRIFAPARAVPLGLDPSPA